MVYDYNKPNEFVSNYRKVVTSQKDINTGAQDTIIGATIGDEEVFYSVRPLKTYIKLSLKINTDAVIEDDPEPTLEDPEVIEPETKPDPEEKENPFDRDPDPEPVDPPPADKNWQGLFTWDDTLNEYRIERRCK